MLPVFGIHIGVDSASSIQETLSRLAERGTTLCISDLSPFEAFVKSYRIAEKLKDERGKEEAKLGLLSIVRGDWMRRLEHNNDDVIEAAYQIRLQHNDPFDCFIFATAQVHKIPLVTEDRAAPEYLEDGLVITWAGLKKSLKA